LSINNKEVVFTLLQEKIIKQELVPGTILHEKELMSQYAIGRTPLREVIAKLKNENLVEIIPQSGTFVKQINFEELKDCLEVRIPLELSAAKIVPYKITNSQIEEIAFIIYYLDKQVNFLSLSEIKKQTTKIHNIYYEATGNKKLTETLISLHNCSSRVWYSLEFQKNNKKGVEETIEEWKKISVLIRTENIKKLQDIMERHIVGFANTLKLNLEY